MCGTPKYSAITPPWVPLPAPGAASISTRMHSSFHRAASGRSACTRATGGPPAPHLVRAAGNPVAASKPAERQRRVTGKNGPTRQVVAHFLDAPYLISRFGW